MMTALVIGVWVIVVLLGTIVGYMQHFTFELEQMRMRQRSPEPPAAGPPREGIFGGVHYKVPPDSPRYLRGNYTVGDRHGP